MSKDIHVMIDFETLSSAKDAAVISIGAAVFGPWDTIEHKFYEKINPLDAERYGTVSAETMKWWDKPENAQARLIAFSGTQSAQVAWYKFHEWLLGLVSEHENGMKDLYPWGNGADFDLPILQHHLEEFNGSYPIDHRNHRCFRTLKNLVPVTVIESVEPNILKHDSLADAIWQANVARRCLSYIGYW
jgi:hypothetical protein